LDAEDAVARATGDTVRILANSDTAALGKLVSKQPITSAYVQSILDTGRRAGPIGGFARGIFLGIFDPAQPGQLLAACWAGANIVPITNDLEHGAYFGQALVALDEHFGSIFGPQPAVTGVWESLPQSLQFAVELRIVQLSMTSTDLSSVLVYPIIRTATVSYYHLVLHASASMSTEHLGYSPLAVCSNGYRLRVRQLIAKGHTMIEADQETVRFKADFGIVTSEMIQIQGVWIRPDARGQGRAAPAMASVVNRALKLVPIVSLYVNDYNTAAIRTYEHVGFAT